MNKQLFGIFLVLIVLPLAMVTGFSVRFLQDQHSMNRMREQQLISQQLHAIDEKIQTLIARHERSLLRQKFHNLDPWALRELVNRHVLMRQLIVFDAHDARIFPPQNLPLSQAETAFLERTRHLREDLGEQTQHETARHPVPKKRRIAPTDDAHNVARDGWRVWYWEEGVHLIYWRADARGYRYGVEVSRVKLLSDIVAQLPVTQNRAYRIALRDSAQQVVYQWGAYGATKTPPSAVQPLSYPLNAWSLAYYQATRDAAPWWVLSPLLVSLLLGVLLVIGLAVYFYQQSSRELREASQRVTFVNQVSHELKTPLTNIRMYAELLDEQMDEQDTRQKHKLQVIIGEAQRLSRMINNVLTFAGKTRSKLRYQPSEWVLDAVVQAVVQQFTLALQAKNLHVRCDLQASESALFDRDIVEQVLGNLLANVEKYAPDSGVVVIQTHQAPGELRLRVQDAGPGVPKRLRRKIFDAFVRGDARLTAGVSGAGIGLSIARHLTRLHGGDLALLESDSGALFEAVLPTGGRE